MHQMKPTLLLVPRRGKASRKTNQRRSNKGSTLNISFPLSGCPTPRPIPVYGVEAYLAGDGGGIIVDCVVIVFVPTVLERFVL